MHAHCSTRGMIKFLADRTLN